MDVLTELFGKGIKEREIFLFSSTKINTVNPHFFICIKRTDNDLLILSCCTTKFDTIRRYVELNGLSNTTLVYIPAKDKNPESPFNQDTYINCNSYIEYTVEEFKTKFKNGELKFKGDLPEEYYEQILIGFHDSDEIDEEIKEMLPKPPFP